MQDTITKPLLKWYGENKRVLPWREKKNPYEIWVSEIMQVQTSIGNGLDYISTIIQVGLFAWISFLSIQGLSLIHI